MSFDVSQLTEKDVAVAMKVQSRRTCGGCGGPVIDRLSMVPDSYIDVIQSATQMRKNAHMCWVCFRLLASVAAETKAEYGNG